MAGRSAHILKKMWLVCMTSDTQRRRPATNPLFNTPDIERDGSLSVLWGVSHTPRSWFEVSGEIPCVRTERSDDAFIMPDSWPPSNHDLTPSNYKIWSNKATRHKFRV